MTESTKRPAPGGKSSSQPSGRRSSTGPSGSPRAGRRETQRRRYEQPSTLQRLRTPLIAAAVIAVVLVVSAFVFTSASAPAYACSSVDTVQPGASGQLGQVQPDQGNQHINSGDQITYPVCPPASGKHINRSGFGPLRPEVYGPDDNSAPNGWVHNLEHGGLVLLYSCERGACDEAAIAEFQGFVNGFPNSAICDVPPGVVGPVVARFEEMPTRFAALLWNRAFYLDELDSQAIYDFFLQYAEVLAEDGSWVAPPEPQCAAPSPGASPSEGASPSAGSSASPAASPAAASPSAAPNEASPSPSAS